MAGIASDTVDTKTIMLRNCAGFQYVDNAQVKAKLMKELASRKLVEDPKEDSDKNFIRVGAGSPPPP